MEQFPSKYIPESCSRCGSDFTCKPLNIAECDCMKIRISPEEQNYISTKGSTCYCNNCLKELKKEYYAQYQKKVFNQNV